jgi:hypothetical protein
MTLHNLSSIFESSLAPWHMSYTYFDFNVNFSNKDDFTSFLLYQTQNINLATFKHNYFRVLELLQFCQHLPFVLHFYVVSSGVCIMFNILLFVLLSFFLWPLCYLSFFDLRLLITPFGIFKLFIKNPTHDVIFNFSYHIIDLCWVLVKVPRVQNHRATQRVSEWRVGGISMFRGVLGYRTKSLIVDYRR